MLIQVLMLLCLFVTCLSSHDFDCLSLILLWPGSHCNMRNIIYCHPTTGKPAPDFIVRSLRPILEHGTNPTNCSPVKPFNVHEVIDLINNNLQKNWPSLKCPPNNGIRSWDANWSKYGSCTDFTQNAYFGAALEWKNELNVLEILASAGVKPSGNRSYDFQTLRKNITDVVGVRPMIYCTKDKHNRTQLYEVRFCLDKSASYVIECPIFKIRPGKSCRGMIKFPSF